MANQPMHEAMLRLAGFLARRRRLVVGVWILIVVASLPLAARQTEHLTGGGFDVPGGESKAVAEAMQGVFVSEAKGSAASLRGGSGWPGARRGARARPGAQRLGGACAWRPRRSKRSRCRRRSRAVPSWNC